MPLKHSVTEVTLKNGAKGLFILVPGTTAVYYDVQFRAGNNYARTPGISQVAHILEHMAFGANAEFPTIESFSQEFTKNGAWSNAHTGSTSLTYEANAGIMEWDRIIDLHGLSVTKPVYTQQLLDGEKGNVREEMTGYANNTGRILWQTIYRRAGLKRWFDEDEMKTIDAVTLDDVKEHYTRTHTAKNMRFIFAGDLEAHMSALVERLEKWELPKGELLPIEIEKAKPTGLVYIHRPEMKNLTFMLDFFLNRRLTRRELRAMSALSHILTDTFHSRIWGEARARGLCYGINSWADTDVTGISDFGLSADVGFENAFPLFELIVKQLKIIAKEGVTEAELQQAKQYRHGASQLGQDTVRTLSGWYDSTYYDTGEIDYLDNMPALIEGTTVEEMRRLAEEFIHSGVWSFGGIGDVSEAELQKYYDLFAKELVEG